MPSYSKKVELPGKTSEELYKTVSEHIDRFLAKSSLGKYELCRDEVKRQVSIKSSMFNATLYCENETLRLEGQLSLLASPFRSKIDEGIDRWIAKNFV